MMLHSSAVTDRGHSSSPAHQEALGHHVLTENGTAHGTVKDIAFEDTTGQVRMLYTALGDISGDRLVGLGSYAVVVRVDSD